MRRRRAGALLARDRILDRSQFMDARCDQYDLGRRCICFSGHIPPEPEILSCRAVLTRTREDETLPPTGLWNTQKQNSPWPNVRSLRGSIQARWLFSFGTVKS